MRRRGRGRGRRGSRGKTLVPYICMHMCTCDDGPRRRQFQFQPGTRALLRCVGVRGLGKSQATWRHAISETQNGRDDETAGVGSSPTWGPNRHFGSGSLAGAPPVVSLHVLVVNVVRSLFCDLRKRRRQQIFFSSSETRLPPCPISPVRCSRTLRQPKYNGALAGEWSSSLSAWRPAMNPTTRGARRRDTTRHLSR